MGERRGGKQEGYVLIYGDVYRKMCTFYSSFYVLLAKDAQETVKKKSQKKMVVHTEEDCGKGVPCFVVNFSLVAEFRYVYTDITQPTLSFFIFVFISFCVEKEVKCLI